MIGQLIAGNMARAAAALLLKEIVSSSQVGQQGLYRPAQQLCSLRYFASCIDLTGSSGRRRDQEWGGQCVIQSPVRAACFAGKGPIAVGCVFSFAFDNYKGLALHRCYCLALQHRAVWPTTCTLALLCSRQDCVSILAVSCMFLRWRSEHAATMLRCRRWIAGRRMTRSMPPAAPEQPGETRNLASMRPHR